jgi:hypothetical protein
MDNLQQVLDSFSKQPKVSTSNNNKRKWREIEQLKEQYQLEKELKAYEDSYDYLLDDL